MRYKAFIYLLLLLWSCSPVAEAPEEKAAIGEQNPPLVAENMETSPVKLHKGWIACGGRWTAGEGASLGQGYADQLGAGVLNAGIAGEPLPGLLQRLPQLLGRKPQGLIIEIGQEDEALNAPPEAFQKHLTTLGKRLLKYPDLKVLILVSAQESAYRDAITTFAESQKAFLLSDDSFAAPPTAAQHNALAEQVRQMLY